MTKSEISNLERPVTNLVLHVTDCLNAGVGKILQEILDNSNSESFFVLWDSHSDSPVFNLNSKVSIERKIKWNRGIITRIIHLRKIVSELNPTVVHAHSSIAGFYIRLFVFGRIKIYSPHCFGFDRLDVSRFQRILFYLAEQIMHFFTTFYVANWPIEVIEMSRFKPRKKIYLFRPMDTFMSKELMFPKKIDKVSPSFIGVGRIRPQKDPELFAKVALRFNEISTGKFIWIGDGDNALKNILIDSGVIIIPWIDAQKLAVCYEEATATLITSKWESGPLTLFESLNYSTPVVMRETKSSKALGLISFKTVENLAEECLRITNITENYDLVKAQRKRCDEAYTTLQYRNKTEKYSKF